MGEILTDYAHHQKRKQMHRNCAVCDILTIKKMYNEEKY